MQKRWSKELRKSIIYAFAAVVIGVIATAFIVAWIASRTAI